MSDPAHSPIFAEIRKSGVRSSLFWWMVEHHDEIIASAAGARLSWERLCPEFERGGLRDARGQPASVATARETWRQARLAVKRDRERRAVEAQGTSNASS